jgi:hypothetical protein
MNKYDNTQNTKTDLVLQRIANVEQDNKRFRDIGFYIYNYKYYYLNGESPPYFKKDMYRITTLDKDQTRIPFKIVYNNEDESYQYQSFNNDMNITSEDLNTYIPEKNTILINEDTYEVNFRIYGKYDKKNYDTKLNKVLSQRNYKPKIGGKTKRIRRRNKSKTKKTSIKKKIKKRRRTIKKKM